VLEWWKAMANVRPESDIPGRTKLLIMAVGCIAYVALIHWATDFKHTW
jgi:hypothetical protein